MRRIPTQTLRTNKTNKTNKNRSIAVAILVAIGLVALTIKIEDSRNANRIAYAKANNCTWHYTGTLYGDDRDSVCK